MGTHLKHLAQRGASNEYPECMFSCRNKQNINIFLLKSVYNKLKLLFSIGKEDASGVTSLDKSRLCQKVLIFFFFFFISP